MRYGPLMSGQTFPGYRTRTENIPQFSGSRQQVTIATIGSVQCPTVPRGLEIESPTGLTQA